MNLQYSERAQNQKVSTDADQVEVDAIKYGSSPIDNGLSDEHMASAMDEFFEDEAHQDQWFEQDLATDSFAGKIRSEILRRVEILGDAYPFKINRNSLVPKDEEFLTYKFCLCVSLQKDISSRTYKALPHTFELMALEYSRIHLGPHAKAIHTGWPRTAGQPTKFKELAQFINENTSEWFWGPDDGLEDDDSNRIKDGGVDFITWLSFPEGFPGQLFITGQCACGNDWKSKPFEANPKNYKKWFNPVTWIDPVQAFCTPFSLVEAYIKEMSDTAGLIYERHRFSALAKDYEHQLPEDLRESMRNCIKIFFDNN